MYPSHHPVAMGSMPASAGVVAGFRGNPRVHTWSRTIAESQVTHSVLKIELCFLVHISRKQIFYWSPHHHDCFPPSLCKPVCRPSGRLSHPCHCGRKSAPSLYPAVCMLCVWPPLGGGGLWSQGQCSVVTLTTPASHSSTPRAYSSSSEFSACIKSLFARGDLDPCQNRLNWSGQVERACQGYKEPTEASMTSLTRPLTNVVQAGRPSHRSGFLPLCSAKSPCW